MDEKALDGQRQCLFCPRPTLNRWAEVCGLVPCIVMYVVKRAQENKKQP